MAVQDTWWSKVCCLCGRTYFQSHICSQGQQKWRTVPYRDPRYPPKKEPSNG